MPGESESYGMFHVVSFVCVLREQTVECSMGKCKTLITLCKI
jgi:hypothetical protein